jgi:ElaB/YqjD/DUF883 family membrane-anchored ribosome-binding protein
MSLTTETLPSGDDTTAHVVGLRERAETLIKDRVAPIVAEAAKSAESAAHTAVDVVKRQADAVSGVVRQRPLLAVLITAGVAFVLGRVLR